MSYGAGECDKKKPTETALTRQMIEKPLPRNLDQCAGSAVTAESFVARGVMPLQAEGY